MDILQYLDVRCKLMEPDSLAWEIYKHPSLTPLGFFKRQNYPLSENGWVRLDTYKKKFKYDNFFC